MIVDFTVEFMVGNTTERRIVQCDVMSIGACVIGPLRRRYNRALRHANRDVHVAASFYGQQAREPYTSYSGEIGGVNGQTMRRRGSFDR